MWKNYVNFTDRTSVKGCWMAVLFNLIAAIILGIIVYIIPTISFISYIYSLAVLLPGLGMVVRRLRDADEGWGNIFWPLLPIIGTIILISLLCKPSVPNNDVPIV